MARRFADLGGMQATTITASNVRDLLTKGTKLTRTYTRTEYVHDPKTYRVHPLPVRHVEQVEVLGLRRFKTGKTRVSVRITTSAGSTYGCTFVFEAGSGEDHGLELAG